MPFVRLHTSIAVPKVLMAFERDDIVYMVTEFIPGTTLEAACPDQGSFSDPFYRSTDYPWGGPFKNIFFRPLPWNPPIIAPTAVAEFNKYWIQRPKLDIAQLSPGPTETMVLTYGDLNAQNILVDDEKIVAIIALESFGWYSESWEFMAIRRGTWFFSNWRAGVEKEFAPRTELQSFYKNLLKASFEEPLWY
ncbi:hypothetical protein GALMADRAFT_132846 [Galerina marginata CBS 339.88]|uniref:Aminoglycoside phosphotransferase domain-containing protein n=1 Tax=Galerina marginata (strain CBS 339.88) TaxID=685588 RepID=A0A067TJI9_GALM3|nr:hypothetical protein GALMADRAFT_132846 [Galerina marginata CBS 339.88]